MKRHSFFSIGTGVRAAAIVASTLTVTVLALAPAAYAQNADDTVGLERPLSASEENVPAPDAPDLALLLDLPVDYFSEITFPPMSDYVIDEPAMMFASLDPTETP